MFLRLRFKDFFGREEKDFESLELVVDYSEIVSYNR